MDMNSKCKCAARDVCGACRSCARVEPSQVGRYHKNSDEYKERVGMLKRRGASRMIL